MTRKAAKKKLRADELRVLMTAIPQVVASELIGKGRTWFRDNPTAPGRNPNSSYNAFELVQGLLSSLEPEELDELKLRERRAEATRKEAAAESEVLALEKVRGDLISRQDATEAMTFVLSTLRDELGEISSRCAVAFSEEEALRFDSVYRAEIDATLARVAKKLTQKVM